MLGNVEHIYAGPCWRVSWTLSQMFSVSFLVLPRREGLRSEAALRSICQASWKSPTSTLDRKRTSKRRCHVSWVEGFTLSLLWTHLQMFSVSTVLGEKATGVEQSRGASAKLPGRRHHHTGQEEYYRKKATCLVSWGFCSLFVLWGCMGMDVWVNVFTMPFLFADSGPWRKMSRAWPAMSAIMTSSGSTCPSHQESAWWAAEARQEQVIVEVVRKGTVAGKCCSICWTHLQMFSVSFVPEEASDVEQCWGGSAKLPGRRPPSHWTGRGQVNEGVMFSELRVLLFMYYECAWVYGNGCVSDCLYNAILVRRLWTVEKDV